MSRFRSLLLIVTLFFTTPLFASVDFNNDYFNDPQDRSYLDKSDNNGDGRPDRVYIKEGDKEYIIDDTDYDYKADTISYYENKELIRKDVDVDRDGNWDRRYWYKDGKTMGARVLSREEVDIDKDGKWDKRFWYGTDGEVKKREESPNDF